MKRAASVDRPLRDDGSHRLGQLLSLFKVSGVKDELPGLLETIVRNGPNVLLLGETGTGKTALAETIQRRFAQRRTREKLTPNELIRTNMAAVPHALAESELFGHIRGAFTGATIERTGCIEQADNGVLFLDELGHASTELQAKLLIAIETRKICKLGARQANSKEVDVLWIAATSRLENVIPELAHRMGDVVLTLLPLRNDEERIHRLAVWFLAKETESMLDRHRQPCEADVVGRGFEAKAMKLLTHHAWPGNIRQLRTVIKRVVMFAPTTPDPISEDTLRRAMQFGIPSDPTGNAFEHSLKNLLMTTDREAFPRMDDVQRVVLTAAWKRFRTQALALKELGQSDHKLFSRYGATPPANAGDDSV